MNIPTTATANIGIAVVCIFLLYFEMTRCYETLISGLGGIGSVESRGRHSVLNACFHLFSEDKKKQVFLNLKLSAKMNHHDFHT